MSFDPNKHVFDLGGKPCEVIVSHESKTVWRAAGTAYGQYISLTRGSSAAALKAWKEAARYWGNVGAPES